ncbi:hypothetical protein CIW48_06235 [Methylobacterium sp. P1-11]|uniref:hypothetical protein n=1 Tax=Methylobacterium sp. P1-11 TaxID=2024616 RepID=UPI0011EFE23B|nr:hypothetical protein [Methylobacterium sp. P1-11]KAA0124825.1 hypothetical protein CIW48_06235 [Methylobacterium sp. P1-11]
MAGIAPSVQGRAGRAARPVLTLLGLLVMTPAPTSAQEPLYIRVRPLSDAEAARAAREMLWARRQAHARTVIESVCTGCLGAWKTEPVKVPAPPDDRIANLTVPIGVELDPGSGASDQQPDSSTLERHP